jgi:protein-S-isoprenylcysteine O-methyltransferase Ste14
VKPSDLYLPSLVTGVAILLYWLEVLRKVARARRRQGAAANFIPPELLGRLTRLVWVPVILIWLGVPLAVAFRVGAHHRLLRPLWQDAPVGWMAAAVVVACWLSTRFCWKQMGKSWRMGINRAEKTALVHTGPFARVRHPIYALSQVMMAASAVAAPAPLLLVAGFAHILLLQWEARREEAHLLAAHGESYARYAATVPRFIPSWNGGRTNVIH